jgi:hypothetical protein
VRGHLVFSKRNFLAKSALRSHSHSFTLFFFILPFLSSPLTSFSPLSPLVIFSSHHAPHHPPHSSHQTQVKFTINDLPLGLPIDKWCQLRSAKSDESVTGQLRIQIIRLPINVVWTKRNFDLPVHSFLEIDNIDYLTAFLKRVCVSFSSSSLSLLLFFFFYSFSSSSLLLLLFYIALLTKT